MAKIYTDEHVFIAGRTGTGKTWLAKNFLKGYKNVVVLDTKGLFSWTEIPGTKWHGRSGNKVINHILDDGAKILTLTNKLEKLPHIKTPKIIYRPGFEEMTLEHFNEFYRWCYFRGNTIVYTDELFSICKNPLTYPEYLKGIMTRGRELNVAHWGATQRPSGIPVVTISEATHFFIFDLNNPDDRIKVATITGCPEFKIKPSEVKDKHSFWYYNVNDSSGKAYVSKIEK